jgi:ABC-type sugar transport system substrate-binding protein
VLGDGTLARRGGFSHGGEGQGEDVLLVRGAGGRRVKVVGADGDGDALRAAEAGYFVGEVLEGPCGRLVGRGEAHVGEL